MREEAIRRVIEILKDEEGNLSDGYCYYCEDNDMAALDSIEDKTLRRIATHIVDTIEEEQKK